MLLAACTPKEQKFMDATGAGSLTETHFISVDGAKLPYKKWIPATQPKAVLLGLHGFNDHKGSYKSLGEYLAKNDIALYAYDQRGFGESENIGIWAGEQNMMRDAEVNLRLLKQKYPDTPVYLVGESMGGAVVANLFAKDAKPDVDGVILIAPAVWGAEGMSPFLRTGGWILAHTIPYAKFTGEGFEKQASDNIEMLRELGKDDLFIKNTRLDSTYGLMNLMGNAYKSGADVGGADLLILYGDTDELVPEKAMKGFVGAIKNDYKFVYYPDSYHMLTRGLGADIVLQDIVSWVDNRTVASGYLAEVRNF